MTIMSLAATLRRNGARGRRRWCARINGSNATATPGCGERPAGAFPAGALPPGKPLLFGSADRGWRGRASCLLGAGFLAAAVAFLTFVLYVARLYAAENANDA